MSGIVFCLKAAGAPGLCRSSSRYITSRITNTIDRSTSARKPSACGRRRTREPDLGYSLKVTPRNHFVNWQQDPQGDRLARYVFPEKATELEDQVDFTAQMTVINPFDFFVEPYADSFPFVYSADLKTELAPYLATIEPGPRSAKYLAEIRAKPPARLISWSISTRGCRKSSPYVIRMKKEPVFRRRKKRWPQAPALLGSRVAVDPDPVASGGSPPVSSPAT